MTFGTTLVFALVHINVGILCGTRNFPTVFDLCPQPLNHVVGCCSHSIPHAGFKVLEVVVFPLVNDLFSYYPVQKSDVIKSGDVGRQEIGASVTILPSDIM